MSNTPYKFRVAICGGGPAGLSLAATIARFNDATAPVAFDIYEAQPVIGTVGAGINVYPRTRQMLERLNLMGKLAGEIGAEEGQEAGSAAFDFRKSDQLTEGYNFCRMVASIHTSARLVSYMRSSDVETGSPITLHFADGTTATADVLIGADGIRSAVRSTMFEGSSTGPRPKWTGTIVYRSLIQREALDAIWTNHRATRSLTIYCGKDKHIVSYPISQGNLVNFIGYYTVPGGEGTSFDDKWVRDVSVEEVQACYSGFEPEIQALLKCLDKVSAWAVHIMDDVPKSVDGRVAMMGDAVHAMEPHFGAGAGQAMEDAYIIGRLLTHPLTTREQIATALTIYEDVRLKFTLGIVSSAREIGKLYEFGGDHRPSAEGEDRNWAKMWGDEVSRMWQWQRNTDAVDEDWSQAEKQLVDAVLHNKLSAA